MCRCLKERKKDVLKSIKRKTIKSKIMRESNMSYIKLMPIIDEFIQKGMVEFDGKFYNRTVQGDIVLFGG